jgi:hypothetical protein
VLAGLEVPRVCGLFECFDLCTRSRVSYRYLRVGRGGARAGWLSDRLTDCRSLLLDDSGGWTGYFASGRPARPAFSASVSSRPPGVPAGWPVDFRARHGNTGDRHTPLATQLAGPAARCCVCRTRARRSRPRGARRRRERRCQCRWSRSV